MAKEPQKKQSDFVPCESVAPENDKNFLIYVISIFFSSLIGYGAYIVLPLITLDFTISIVASLLISSTLSFMWGMSVEKKILQKNRSFLVEIK